MTLVARVTLTDGRVTPTSTITIWDGATSVKEIPVPLRSGPDGNWALVRVTTGLHSLGLRIVDAGRERRFPGGSEFDVEPVR